MVRQPKDLAEAKQIFREEKAKVSTSLTALAGSRWLMAILATFVIAFGSHLGFAPARLPQVSGLSLTQAGLPPNLDFGVIGEQAQAAREAAERQNVRGEIETRFAEQAAANANLVPILNGLGFAVAFILLMINMTIMTKRRRVSRG